MHLCDCVCMLYDLHVGIYDHMSAFMRDSVSTCMSGAKPLHGAVYDDVGALM